MLTSNDELAPTRETLLSHARDLVPVLRQRSLEINQARHVPPEIMALLYDAGLMGLVRPVSYNGPGLGMDLVFEIARILDEGDGSVAWVYVVTNSHDHLVGLYPQEIQNEYWVSSQPLCASSYQPSGKAVPVEGGYRLSGEWSFCSGIDHCGWVVVGSIVNPQPNEASKPDLGLFLLRKQDIKIVDDWHMMGLAGTGSKSISVTELFVPNAQILYNSDVQKGEAIGRALHENPLYSTSIWLLFGFSVLAPATGIARGAYENLAADFRARIAANDRMFESRRMTAQMRLAEASAFIDAAELLFNRSLSESYDLIMQRQPVSDFIRTRNRRDQAFVAKLCRQAMDILMSQAGARGLKDSGVIQRATRDLFAISAHPGGNWDAASASFGSVQLGGPPTEMFC